MELPAPPAVADDTIASKSAANKHRLLDLGAESGTDKDLALTSDGGIENGQTEQTWFSKVSVYLMMLFFSIAMGSDG
jgi:hypothetical protein